MLPISFSFASEQLKYLVSMENFPGFFSNSERVVNRLPLMTYGLKLSLEASILKFKKNHSII